MACMGMDLDCALSPRSAATRQCHLSPRGAAAGLSERELGGPPVAGVDHSPRAARTAAADEQAARASIRRILRGCATPSACVGEQHLHPRARPRRDHLRRLGLLLLLAPSSPPPARDAAVEL